MGSGMCTHITELAAEMGMRVLLCTTLGTDHTGVSWEGTSTLHSHASAPLDPGKRDGAPGRWQRHTPLETEIVSCRNGLSRGEVVQTARMEQ